jgi:hypothetical protein
MTIRAVKWNAADTSIDVASLSKSDRFGCGAVDVDISFLREALADIPNSSYRN